MSNRKFVVSAPVNKFAIPLVDVNQEAAEILDISNALRDVQEQINALRDAGEECDKMQACLDTNMEALDHLKKFGLTKSFLKAYNSEGEIDKLVGDVLVEYEYFDTMNKKTIQYATENITDTLVSVGKGVWAGLCLAANEIVDGIIPGPMRFG